ncbi:centrosomal protein of 126 kDa isoform X3 [Gopherus flavomarginatus]|uniref:centrosomal protein of 126 kDa isoform X3 n=1 Tax=Gopherus flavomarginatus TaxID=286002 RepID=UPI0021CC1A6E|nr:centrosomal protein of 126 kDa isoform X3 [Gopherus flavomarginatus]
MEPGMRAAGGLSPAQREPGSAAPGGPGWRSLFRPEPDSALQSQAGTFAGSACATLKFLLERDLEEEREALLEDQKICRSRARKLCIETNRRRKALEEKQRAKEEKELRFREQILKQRKLKLQEATEKFQRAHLPFSQRKRIVQRKPAPRLEEALEQIQGSVLTSGLYLSSSNRHKSSCRITDSSSDSSESKNGFLHQKQISTNGGYDKMIQESSGTNLDSDQLLLQQNLEEMRRLLEKQHLSSLANFHQEVNQITNSDSPSSLDSLEAGEQNENYTTPSETSLTTQWDDSIPYNSQNSQSMNKSFLDTPELTFSKNQHVNNWLINLDTQNSQPNTPFHDTLAKQNVLIPAENVHNPKQKSFVLSGTEKRTTDMCTSDNQITFVNSPCTFMQNRKEEKNNMLKVPSSGMVRRESSLATDNPVFKSSKAWVTSDSTARERVLDSVQEQSSELTQERTTTSSVQTSNQPMATPVILPPKQWSSTGVHNSTFSSNPLQKGKNTNTVPCTDNLDNLSETKDENIKNFNGINQGSSLFQDTSNASILCNTDQEEDKKEEKGNVAEAMSPLSNAKFSGELSEHHRYLKNNMHERKRVKLPKSILKKESKYENYCFKAVVLNRRISFGNQTVSSIRDSLELAKIKGKDAENQKTNKKLRWFDETDKIVVEDDENCSEKYTTGVSQTQLQPSYVQSKLDANNNLRSIPTCTTESICTENHQDYPPISTKIVAAGGSERDCMPLRCFVSTGYHFAKQAWMASKGDESKPRAYSGDSKIQKGDFRHYDARYNNSCSTNLQPIKANVSHVTLDGGNLLTTFKSSRMNGFFSSSNGAVPVTRRKQISDNSENKRRALLEQRRQTVASAGRRPTHHAQNTVHTIQLSPFQCAFEPVQTVSGIPNSDEVSESTAQFLLAENLAGTSVTEGEILAALETVQPPGQTMVLNKAKRRGMSALSLEEQKILQSLDRLNQRLQNVQETIAKNLSTSSVLQIISPLNIQQSASSPSVDPPLAMRRYRSMSADTLARLQRRY